MPTKTLFEIQPDDMEDAGISLLAQQSAQRFGFALRES
jgi:hypothetical protein